MANKPVFSSKTNRVEVAVWRNESEDTIWHNITFQKNYRDDDGTIKATSNFKMDDLPAIAFLAAKAYDFLASGEDI
ncbi:MAG: hypothetical protein KDB03_05040 [Planctomycetales bacterium]|nr:hypothetical protein [Planctomycetales bacterium]